MATGTLYRPHARNEHGDPVNADGQVARASEAENLGTITGLVIGGPSWRPTNRRGEVVDTTGQVGIPADSDVQPTHGDLLVIDGVKFKIHGLPQWASRGVVPTPPRYRWWTVTAVAN